MAVRILILTFVATVCLSSQAWAAQSCDKTEDVLESLETKYNEAVVAGGPTVTGALLQILASPPDSEKPTWTAIVTLPSGFSCFVAAGENWRQWEPPLGDPS